MIREHGVPKSKWGCRALLLREPSMGRRSQNQEPNVSRAESTGEWGRSHGLTLILGEVEGEADSAHGGLDRALTRRPE